MGARAGGDDDAFCAYPSVVADLDGVCVQKFCLADDAPVFVPCHHVFHYEADEAVALGFDACHDFASVCAHAGFVKMYAERVGMQGVVARFGGGY